MDQNQKAAPSSCFESVCQVTSESGYCKLQPPSALVETPGVDFRKFGTFENPFSENSLWNSRPRLVSLGDYEIPKSDYYPMIGPGAYSTSVFKASPTDQPMTLYPFAGSKGVWNPDAEEHMPCITIPHWPADTVAAEGTDGHADIVDEEAGIIHSLWQLRQVDGRWTVAQYAWAPLYGLGFGDGAHYFQGARAAGVCTMAGMIRKHEINDGADQYFHALAMSLDFSGLSKTHQYVFPATAGDAGWRENYGGIPEGALLMLPASFYENSINNPALRKVVNTLKTFGAYVVDRNHGTPFYIYVENDSDFNLHRDGWNSKTGDDLQRIRAALRQVTYATDWVNGNGRTMPKPEPLNMLSMRGPWKPVMAGGSVPKFETHMQAVVFGKTDKVQNAENASGRSIANLAWLKPVPGKFYKFSVFATNGGTAYLRFWGDKKEQFNTGKLKSGEYSIIKWPDVAGVPIVGAVSGIGEQTIVRATLTEIEQ